MIRSKKAMVLYYIVIFGLIVSIGYFAITQLLYKSESGISPGIVHMTLQRVVHQADEILTFVASAAHRASSDALDELAENGGFADDSPCQRYLGYNRWSVICRADIEQNYEKIFNPLMNSIIEKYPENNKGIETEDAIYTPTVSLGAYKISGINNKLYGTSNKPFIMEFFGKGFNRELGKYTFRPDFEIQTTFDYEVLKTIEKDMKSITTMNSKEAEVYINTLKTAQWRMNGCTPKTSEELFYDVIEHLEQCIHAEDACSCDLAQTELDVLNDNVIELSGSGDLIAELKDSNDRMIKGHAFNVRRKILANGEEIEGDKITLDKNTAHKIERSDDSISFGDSSLPRCAPPSLTKFRMCAAVGDKEFKFAVELD